MIDKLVSRLSALISCTENCCLNVKYCNTVRPCCRGGIVLHYGMIATGNHCNSDSLRGAPLPAVKCTVFRGVSAKTYCPTGGINASPTVRTQCVRKSSNNNLSGKLSQSDLHIIFFEILRFRKVFPTYRGIILFGNDPLPKIELPFPRPAGMLNTDRNFVDGGEANRCLNGFAELTIIVS